MRPVILTTLANGSLDISVSNGQALTVRPGGRFRVPVVIANAGKQSIAWSPKNPLHLAYRWIGSDGAVVERDGMRTIIPAASLTPGSPVDVEMVGAAPEEEGRYQLQLSLVLEGVHWACDLGAGGWLELAVPAVPAPTWPTALHGSRAGRALRGALAAKELARQLEGRSFTVEAPAAPIVTQEEPAVEPALAPPVTVAEESRPVLVRLRDWFRKALGVTGVEHQLRDVLDRAGRHEQQVAELETSFLSIKDALRSEIEAAGRARALVEEVAAGQRDLKTQLLSMERESQARSHASGDVAERMATSLSDLGQEVETHLLSMSSVMQGGFEDLDRSARGLAGMLAKARADVLSKVATRQQVKQVGEMAAGLQRLLMDEAESLKQLQNEAVKALASLDRGLATRSSIDAEQRRLLVDVHAAVDARATELARLAEGESEKLLDAWSRHLEGFRNEQSALGSKLNALGRAQGRVSRELREGSVVVELIANIRQLIAWAQAAGDIGVIVSVNETLERLAAQSGERAVEEAAHWDTLDLQVVRNSLKIDSLLTRQAIPLASAGVVLVRNRFGLLAIPDEDAPAIAYYATGDLPEPGTVAVVERLLQPGDCFLDVGANVGIYSLIAGRRVGPEGKVVAVEPSPSTMRALGTTLAINGIAQLTQTHECALGEAEGTATLHCEPTSGHNSLVGPTKTTRSKQIVAVKRGEEILDGLKPALIKIDVEGWELDVLRGLDPVIKANKRLSAVVEYSPGHIRRRNMQPDAWLEQVKAFGFKMWIIEDSDISLRPISNATEIGDRGVNLFLSRVLPPALKSMLHDQE